MSDGGRASSRTPHVTRYLAIGGSHVVHAEDCRAFPRGATEPLGTFEGCAPPLLKLRESRGPVEACTLFCSRRHDVAEAEVTRAALRIDA